jgi:hypothetical protein
VENIILAKLFQNTEQALMNDLIDTKISAGVMQLTGV